MKKSNISKKLIILIIAFLSVIKAYGETTAEQSVQTDVQPAVAIEKLTGSQETATMTDIRNGIHTGMRALYSIKTNGSDSDYDFVITAKTLIDGEQASAYTKSGALIFARVNQAGSNISPYPNSDDLSNIQAESIGNRNIIAYPVNISTSAENEMTTSFQKNYKEYGDCYKILINDNSEGNVTYDVSGTPVANTYNLAEDEAGTYQTTVTITAYPK